MKNFGVFYVEALEPRIAPAAFVFTNGANLLSAGDQGYLSEPGDGGDSILLVDVKGGKALVFWDADNREIRGISVSHGANLIIYGDVKGDIVTNLLPSGYLTDSDNNPSNGLDGGRLLNASITGITTVPYVDSLGVAQNGAVGKIVAGGSVSNVSLSGNLGGVFAGDGIFDAVATAPEMTLTNGNASTTFVFDIGFAWDTSGPLNGVTKMEITMGDSDFQGGASITGVTFAGGSNVQIFAGDGLSNIKGQQNGGSISKVSFVGALADVSVVGGFFEGVSYTISAGDGADATGGNAGSGGGILSVSELGSGGDAILIAGDGGNTTIKGTGGAGGSVSGLELQGSVTAYTIVAGNGGNGIAGGPGGSVSNVNITSQGNIALAAPFFSANGEDFFVIDRGSGRMTTVDGDKLSIVQPFIPGKASGPVDAITVDLNGDGWMDVVVIYADKSLGVLINNSGDGTFDYTTKDLGFVPTKVLSGFFSNTTTLPELALISSSQSQTVLRLFSAVDQTVADNFTSDTSKFTPFIIQKGKLADAVGGTIPTAGFKLSLELQDYKFTDLRADLILGFADGLIQGVSSKGVGTIDDPFTFLTKGMPSTKAAGGIKDLDYNFGSNVTTNEQALAVVNAAGTQVRAASIALPPEVPDQPSSKVYKITLGAPVSVGSGMNIVQASWIAGTFDAEFLGEDYPALMVLANDGSSSTRFSYFGSISPEAGVTLTQGVPIVSDLTLTGMAVNTNTAVTNIATSYGFLTGIPTLMTVRVGPFDYSEPIIITFGVQLDFPLKDVALFAGDGGNATTGLGGHGGGIKGVGIDANIVTIFSGEGGSSTVGSGGNGGSFNNASAFRLSGVTVRPTLTAGNLVIDLGDGGDGGTGASSKGGNGGSLSGLTISSVGVASIFAGDGGDSNGGVAGSGGSASVVLFNGGNLSVTAGDGGSGFTSTKAAGGSGGNVTIVAGDISTKGTREIEGSIFGKAGDGGGSEFAKAGNGGNISGGNVQKMTLDGSSLVLIAGNGGVSTGTDAKALGGAGGSVSGFRFAGEPGVSVNVSLSAGKGGDTFGGNGGAGGSLIDTKLTGGLINLNAGDGGNSGSTLVKSAGGIGGGIIRLTANTTGSGYLTIESGTGGSAVAGAGGAGGPISNLNFTFNPDNVGVGDQTLGLTLKSGGGGDGARGGAGGLISGLQVTAIHDNFNPVNLVTIPDHVAMLLIGGQGGKGTVTEGGAGGSISLSRPLVGISFIDPDSVNPNFLPEDEALRVYGGDGGEGVTKGGAGGNVSGLRVANGKNNLGESIPANLLGSAEVRGGNGGFASSGDGGAGGSVNSSRLVVERFNPGDLTGNLRIEGGNGGDSALGRGGLGGAVNSSFFASVNGSNDLGYGVFVTGGLGGDGKLAGGGGGGLNNLTISIPSVGDNGTDPTLYGAVILGGNGGDGTGVTKSTGGAGGSITGISQPKDAYAVINLIQAGSGGNSSADVPGGAGGNVANVNSQGAIGAQFARASKLDPFEAQGVFNEIASSPFINGLTTSPHLQQGVFAGVGGTGSAPGNNGSVSAITARAIAAIGASDINGAFQNATTVSRIATLVLAYDINNNGTYEAGDGFVRADNFDITRDLVSVEPQVFSTAALQAKTAPFVNP